MLEAIKNLEQEAKVICLRALANSTLFSAIGAVRMHLRDMSQQHEAEKPTIDQHNDEEAKKDGDKADEQAGFKQNVDWMAEAGKLMGLHNWAAGECRTVAQNRFQEPMLLEDALEFLAKEQPVPEENVAAVAKAMNIDPELVRQMHSADSKRQAQFLLRDTPLIIELITAFGTEGYETSFDELNGIRQYSLTVKVISALHKEKLRLVSVALRNLDVIGIVPIIDEATKQMLGELKQVEKQHRDELQEAHEAGINLPTIPRLTVKLDAA